MSKTTIQYRGKEVVVPTGNYATIDCRKKIMHGQIVVNVESTGTEVTQDLISLKENNKEYNVTDYKRAFVEVPIPEPKLQSKNATPSNRSQIIECDKEYDGLETVTITAVPTETVTITSASASVEASAGKFIDKVIVNVPTLKVHTGTTVPSDSLGKNGDIYLLLEE